MMENERVLISLKSGDIYLITLLSDGMRSIKKFSWLKAATSVLTSCLCMATGQSNFPNCAVIYSIISTVSTVNNYLQYYFST